MKPNLFNYATSELSQDAFLLWLLEWANPSNAEYDSALHKTASDFLRKMMDVDDKFLIDSVECKKQQYHIDVLAIVNGNIAIIIEDKVNTLEHGNQIARYREQLKGALGTDFDIRCVYLKTGNECLTKLRENAKKNDFKIWMRKDLLEILEKCDSQNPILTDFVWNLKQVEDWTNEYRIKPYADWNAHVHAWQGFYSWLEENSGEWVAWHYVSNAKGGFWCCCGHWKWSDEYNFDIFLQIEQGRICFKADSHPQKDAVKNCFAKLSAAASRYGINLLPSRFHRGTYVTIGYIDTAYFFSTGSFEEKEVREKWNLLTKIIDEIAN